MKAKDRQRLNRRIAARIGAYGMIKRHEHVTHLSDTERDEVAGLEAKPGRSPAQQARMEALWGKASRGHHEEQERMAVEAPDAFFEEVRATMWARRP